ncbi:hypothetical protein M1105_18885 [Limibaculum sp. FT325]|uniref:hypothetical protein n=1 Tax=Thermohalobaculum sediminis TaxID=2939436 RepID=UPI0020BE1734|nr:hypothetical protein [Limibaculum sediminis]MCL5779036.1 hypothetical protein [Limibaculum sediminis]
METQVPIGESKAGLAIRMMGALCVVRDGSAVELPASRKLRALLAYLALAERPVGRSRLCELMGDVPNDPRRELRWYLSKLRSVLDGPERPRVLAEDDLISLDLAGAWVDVIEIGRTVPGRLGPASVGELLTLEQLFTGDFLEGLDLNRSPQMDHWLTTRRRHFREQHAAVLAAAVGHAPCGSADARRLAERWVELAPFDVAAHAGLMATLGPADADRHLEAAIRLFEAEGLDAAPLRLAARARRPAAMAAEPSRPVPEPPQGAASGQPAHRASLAVMPFRELDAPHGAVGFGAGLTSDIITRLAKLRFLFVIARGSVFALQERGIDQDEAGRQLNVDYLATGYVRRHGGRISIAVELTDARSSRIVWSDVYEAGEDDTFEVLDRLGDRIVWSIASEIETAETNRALLKPPNSLNAWEAYHRGLWHMYRFTKADNEAAQRLFRSSIEADPTFSRAYSGLSFTHWQNAFQNWSDRGRETDLAFDAAGSALMADTHDPSAHWAMGRALWLRRDETQAVAELEQAVHISPNYAMGHYSLAFVQAQSGDAAAAIGSADLSSSLSPFDPLLFGIYGAKAMACVRLGRVEEAAEWALKAVTRPNAHILIQQIAAFCLTLAGRIEEARLIAAEIRRARPDYRAEEFLCAFHFSAEAEALFRRAASELGLD